jgi:hypothetical protein
MFSISSIQVEEVAVMRPVVAMEEVEVMEGQEVEVGEVDTILMVANME